MMDNTLSISGLRHARLKAAGLCVRCGKVPPGKDVQRCGPCNRQQLESLRRSRERLTGMADYAASFEEIAKELGISASMARTLLSRALRKLRRACREQGISAADIVGRPVSMTERLEWL